MMLKRNSHLGKPRNIDAQLVSLCIYCTLYLGAAAHFRHCVVLCLWQCSPLQVLCLLVLQPTSGIVFIVFYIWCCRPLLPLTTSTMLLHCFLFSALVFHSMTPMTCCKQLIDPDIIACCEIIKYICVCAKLSELVLSQFEDFHCEFFFLRGGDQSHQSHSPTPSQKSGVHCIIW